MPVRIYDISKKLGLENKEVLAKAKELGISAAKVPSSSLDKITAEYLENELTGGRPVASATPTAPPAEPEKIILVTAPPPKPELVEPVVAEVETTPEAEAHGENGETTATPPEPESPVARPADPVVPPPPTGPQLGDKVGFIQLPTKSAPRTPDKTGPVKLPPGRPGTGTGGSRPDLGRGR